MDRRRAPLAGGAVRGPDRGASDRAREADDRTVLELALF